MKVFHVEREELGADEVLDEGVVHNVDGRQEGLQDGVAVDLVRGGYSGVLLARAVDAVVVQLVDDVDLQQFAEGRQIAWSARTTDLLVQRESLGLRFVASRLLIRL